jgi:hypothetical protein
VQPVGELCSELRLAAAQHWRPLLQCHHAAVGMCVQLHRQVHLANTFIRILPDARLHERALQVTNERHLVLDNEQIHRQLADIADSLTWLLGRHTGNLAEQMMRCMSCMIFDARQQNILEVCDADLPAQVCVWQSQ